MSGLFAREPQNGQAVLIIRDVGVAPGHRHAQHKTRQNCLADTGRLGRVGNVQNDQAWPNTNVSIIAVHGDSMACATDLAHEFHV